MRQIVANIVYALIAVAISACAGSSESMPTLPTAGGLTAGATSSAAQTENSPIASGRPLQIVVFPFATSASEVTLNQGLGARLYREYIDQNQTADQTQLAQATAQNICMQIGTSLASNGWHAACPPRGTYSFQFLNSLTSHEFAALIVNDWVDSEIPG